jgi:hypothetical protein
VTLSIPFINERVDTSDLVDVAMVAMLIL